jgi:hypothetical protein
MRKAHRSQSAFLDGPWYPIRTNVSIIVCHRGWATRYRPYATMSDICLQFKVILADDQFEIYVVAVAKDDLTRKWDSKRIWLG